MSVQHLNRPSSLPLFRDEIDRLVERFFGDYQPFRLLNTLHLHRFPEMNLWQDDDKVYVEAELPGLSEGDIELTVIGNKLTIKGERPEIQHTEGVGVHRRERGAGFFSRTIEIPVEVDQSKVEAVCRNGVLTITLAKVLITQSRHIPIKAVKS